MDLPQLKEQIKVGQHLPSVELTEGTPLTRVNITDICRRKKVVLLGVVGAFTPACTTFHLPEFIDKRQYLKQLGYQEIVCVTINDIFVTNAWGNIIGAEGKVRLLADPNGEFTKAIGFDEHIPAMGGIRIKRYSMIVNNNVVKQIATDPQATHFQYTLSEKLMF